MKNATSITFVIGLILILSTNVFAQDLNVQNKKMLKNQVNQNHGPNWIDEDGDGICDNNTNLGSSKRFQGEKSGANKNNRKGGFGDGLGLRPQDGSGFGNKNNSGDCDGLGPKGTGKRKGGK